MDSITDLSMEKHLKGFSYYEKNPTTEQIFKRRKLSEYSSSLSNHYQSHSSIDEYVSSTNNCNNRSNSRNDNNNTFINVKQNQTQTNFNHNYQLQNQKLQDPSFQSSSSFRPSKQLNTLCQGKKSLKDFLNLQQSSQQSNSSQYIKVNQVKQSQQEQAIDRENKNFFEQNNYSFKQIINSSNYKEKQNEYLLERKCLDSMLENSLQNLSISENKSKNLSQCIKDYPLNQKTQQANINIINIPKAIKSQAPQYFNMEFTSGKQNQIITTRSLNSIIQNKLINDRSEQISQNNKIYSENLIDSQNNMNTSDVYNYQNITSFSKLVKGSEERNNYSEQQIQQLIKLETDNDPFLFGNKQIQQSANRGRLLLGDNCPLKALKKSFPIVFPVGIPIMGQLSKLLNMNEENINQIKENNSLQDSNQHIQNQENSSFLQLDDLLKEQQQSSSYQLSMMEMQIDPLVGHLTRSERREKVERYLEKKKNRKWKSIRYNIRKNLADNRVRVQGRFVKQKNGRFIDLLDAQYLQQLTKESDKMKLLDISHNTDNSFEIQNNSFEM